MMSMDHRCPSIQLLVDQLRQEFGKISDGVAATLAKELAQSRKFVAQFRADRRCFHKAIGGGIRHPQFYC